MISPAEYIKLEEDTGERFEYWNGEVFPISVGALPHNQITARLVQRIWVPDCETLGSSQRIVVLETGLETYPDVSVFRGKAQLAGTLGMAVANPCVLTEYTESSAALSLESLAISIPGAAIYDGVELEAGGAR